MDCTIIIFHFESLAYLRACIRQIHKYKRDDIRHKIIIADQSVDEDVIRTVYEEFPDDKETTTIHMNPFGSGYSVDHILRNHVIDTEFVCTIDVDTLPIHKNWLYAPMRLIQETNMTWVGVHAQVESAYAYMGNFFALCQHFRVARTDTYKELALNAGFVKQDHRDKLSYVNNEWHGWSDDGTTAHWWEDQYCNHSKFTIAVSHFLGTAPTEGMYGRYTDDLVLHFGFSYNWKKVRDQKECMGDEYLVWMQRMSDEGLSEELFDEILNGLRPLEVPILRLCWDGNTKSIYTPDNELNMLFDKFKGE